MSDATNGNERESTSAAGLENILSQVEGQRYPPVNQWNPEFCGDIDMRIAADGTWYYLGSPIGRKEMVRLFSTILRHDEDGKYYLVTPVEKIGISVDDAPFIAVDVTRAGAGETQILSFRTRTDDMIIAGPTNPIRVELDPDTKEPRPYLLVRDRLEALISRPVFYDLVEISEHRVHVDSTELGVWSRGEFFSLGQVSNVE